MFCTVLCIYGGRLGGERELCRIGGVMVGGERGGKVGGVSNANTV